MLPRACGPTPPLLLLPPSGVVDAVLIPEVPFKLEGPTGLLAYLESVIENKGHAVVCLAEGAGQVRGRDRRGGKETAGPAGGLAGLLAAGLTGRTCIQVAAGPTHSPHPCQDILDDHSNGGTDASGNPILKDIGWARSRGWLGGRGKVVWGECAGQTAGGWGSAPPTQLNLFVALRPRLPPPRLFMKDKLKAHFKQVRAYARHGCLILWPSHMPGAA